MLLDPVAEKLHHNRKFVYSACMPPVLKNQKQLDQLDSSWAAVCFQCYS